MNKKKLKALVSEGIDVDRNKVRLEDRLKEIKAKLVDEARSRPDEMTPGEGGGDAWLAEGEDGCIARVAFPVPTLKRKIAGEGKDIDKIRKAAGRFFPDLFEQDPAYRTREGFREISERLMGKSAGKLLKLITIKTAPRVSFETKDQPF